jgi:hypothetical protein
MNHMANKNEIIARRAPLVAVGNTLPQLPVTLTVSGVLLLAKGIAIFVIVFLSYHRAKPNALPCRTYSGIPWIC